MEKSLRDFKRYYNRHVGRWIWKEKSPSPRADELGHVTEGKAASKAVMNAQIRLELQRRRQGPARLDEAPDSSPAA
jgi:hypothetical protein